MAWAIGWAISTNRQTSSTSAIALSVGQLASSSRGLWTSAARALGTRDGDVEPVGVEEEVEAARDVLG